MKIQILRDSKGKVIATFERTPAALVSMEPEVSEDEEVIEVDVPDEYIRMPAAGFIKRLQEDIWAQRLEIVHKE